MYRAIAIKGLKVGEPFTWQESYFLIGRDKLEDCIQGAIYEREGRGGKYGAVIYGPTGYEEGIVPAWSQEGFIERSQYQNK